MILEWLVGFSYRVIMGENMWTYHRLELYGFTSFLSLPLWGLIGVVFLLLTQILARG